MPVDADSFCDPVESNDLSPFLQVGTLKAKVPNPCINRRLFTEWMATSLLRVPLAVLSSPHFTGFSAENLA